MIIEDLEEPLVRIVGENSWELAEDYTVYFSRDGYSRYRITIEKGYVTDGASVPQVFWSLGFVPTGLHFAAAVVHDKLYWAQGKFPPASLEVYVNQYEAYAQVWSRKACDEMFKQLMLKAGSPWWKAQTMYLAVRACGWLYWAKAFKTK